MGYASYLIYRDGAGKANYSLALNLYASQLVLNMAWMPIFYRYHKLGLVSIVFIVINIECLEMKAYTSITEY